MKISDKTVHVIGAGIAGLSTAIHLSDTVDEVLVYESSSLAGGRCRAFFDEKLGVTIDNGNHLVLGVNTHFFEMVDLLGVRDQLLLCNKGTYPFVDSNTLQSWVFSNVFQACSAMPHSTSGNILRMVRVMLASKGRTVSQLCDDKLFDFFWHPLAVSMLNTPSEYADGDMFIRVLKQVAKSGKAGFGPYIPARNWSETLITPMVEYLRSRDVEVSFNTRIKRLSIKNNSIYSISHTKGEVIIGEKDVVVLAVPPFITEKLFSNVSVPNHYHSIVNVHFLYDSDVIEQFLGVTNSPLHWIFRKRTEKGGVLSTTTSAADDFVSKSDEEIALIIWKEIKKILSVSNSVVLPPYRVIKEKRATFACTKLMNDFRPPTSTSIKNLFLAGDYTDTGLPATIEGAMLSGKKAAQSVISTL